MIRRTFKRLSSTTNNATLNDVVRELKAIKTENNDVIRELKNDVVRELKAIKTELKGFTGNIAKSNEQEVVEAARCHLIKERFKIVDVAINHKVIEKNKVIAEFDGFITMENCYAVVEVKSNVKMKSVEQLEKACNTSISKFGPTVGFLGGTLFQNGVKEAALQKGFKIVEVSGKRYRVLSGKSENDAKVKSSG